MSLRPKVSVLEVTGPRKRWANSKLNDKVSLVKNETRRFGGVTTLALIAEGARLE